MNNNQKPKAKRDFKQKHPLSPIELRHIKELYQKALKYDSRYNSDLPIDTIGLYDFEQYDLSDYAKAAQKEALENELKNNGFSKADKLNVESLIKVGDRMRLDNACKLIKFMNEQSDIVAYHVLKMRRDKIPSKLYTARHNPYLFNDLKSLALLAMCEMFSDDDTIINSAMDVRKYSYPFANKEDNTTKRNACRHMMIDISDMVQTVDIKNQYVDVNRNIQRLNFESHEKFQQYIDNLCAYMKKVCRPITASRNISILKMLAQGNLFETISKKLNIEKRTLSVYKCNLYKLIRKYNADNNITIEDFYDILTDLSDKTPIQYVIKKEHRKKMDAEIIDEISDLKKEDMQLFETTPKESEILQKRFEKMQTYRKHNVVPDRQLKSKIKYIPTTLSRADKVRNAQKTLIDTLYSYLHPEYSIIQKCKLRVNSLSAADKLRNLKRRNIQCSWGYVEILHIIKIDIQLKYVKINEIISSLYELNYHDDKKEIMIRLYKIEDLKAQVRHLIVKLDEKFSSLNICGRVIDKMDSTQIVEKFINYTDTL